MGIPGAIGAKDKALGRVELALHEVPDDVRDIVGLTSQLVQAPFTEKILESYYIH